MAICDTTSTFYYHVKIIFLDMIKKHPALLKDIQYFYEKDDSLICLYTASKTYV